jgi:hypothetical protein
MRHLQREVPAYVKQVDEVPSRAVGDDASRDGTIIAPLYQVEESSSWLAMTVDLDRHRVGLLQRARRLVVAQVGAHERPPVGQRVGLAVRADRDGRAGVGELLRGLAGDVDPEAFFSLVDGLSRPARSLAAPTTTSPSVATTLRSLRRSRSRPCRRCDERVGRESSPLTTPPSGSFSASSTKTRAPTPTISGASS